MKDRKALQVTVVAAMASTALLLLLSSGMTAAFAPQNIHQAFLSATTSAALATTKRATELRAIGVLAKKAKQADLRKYVQGGVEPEVMEYVKKIKDNIDSVGDLASQSPGPLQEALTRRKGTITVIAEYKRNNAAFENNKIPTVFDPELLSPQFREYGASAIAVLADERMGGCTYDDIRTFVEEQRRARNEVPGPLPVINNDLVVDEIQVARTAACGAVACVITLGVVGVDELPNLLRACHAVDIEPIVGVRTPAEAQQAVDAGGRILSVVGIDGVDEKVAVIDSLSVPDGQQVCTIANILCKNDKELKEIEEAWAIRDKGFNCGWVGEALYKAGGDATESPGNIIKSMKSKSSLKWASPKATTGRGEGAREYLGDILM